MHNLNTDLIELLNSLNKSQRLLISRKWAFPPYTSYKYVLLYQCLTTYRNSTVESILFQFPEINQNQIQNLQNELYIKILNAISNNTPSTPFERYRVMVKNYLTLYGLNLIAQANKMKAKADTFKKQNDLLSQYHFLDEELLLSGSELYLEPSKKRKEHKQPLIKIYNDVRHKYLNQRFTKNEDDYDVLKRKIQSQISQISVHSLTLLEKIIFHGTYYQYHYIQRDFLLAYKHSSNMVQLYELNNLTETFKDTYFKLLNYQLLCLFRLNSSDRFNNSLEKFKSLNISSKSNNANLLRTLHYKYGLTHRLNASILKGDFDEGILDFEDSKPQFLELDNVAENAFINSINYKVACMYFSISNFEECLFYLNKIIHNPIISGRPDLQMFARILRLTTLFETQDPYVFENIRTVYSFLARNKEMNAFQIEIMRFLRQCAGLPQEELDSAFRTLRINMIKIAEDRFEQSPFFYFDIISWLDSRLGKESISEIIKKRGLGHRVLYNE